MESNLSRSLPGDGPNFEFAIDNSALAFRLRELADKIEARTLVVERVETSAGHAHDDFAQRILSLHYREAW